VKCSPPRVGALPILFECSLTPKRTPLRGRRAHEHGQRHRDQARPPLDHRPRFKADPMGTRMRRFPIPRGWKVRTCCSCRRAQSSRDPTVPTSKTWTTLDQDSWSAGRPTPTTGNGDDVVRSEVLLQPPRQRLIRQNAHVPSWLRLRRRVPPRPARAARSESPPGSRPRDHRP
jgi:hypothetical protein